MLHSLVGRAVVGLAALTVGALASPTSSPTSSSSSPPNFLFVRALVGMVTLMGGALASSTSSTSPTPNFLFFLVDDMDDGTLSSLSSLPVLASDIITEGILFSNTVVSSPVCCPSRTSLFSGRMPHNIGDVEHGWCGNFTAQREDNFLLALKERANYTIGQIGKWYNEEPTFCVANYTPAWHTGPNDTSFLLCNECTYFSNRFNDNGALVDYGKEPEDYMTSVLGNKTIAWLDVVTDGTNPWFGLITPHAPHLPATPAPWYADAEVPGVGAPRTPNWNTGWEDKHFLIDNKVDKPMSQALINGSDALWASRLRSLLSVNDILRDALALLERKNALDNTYVIMSSDHGYHLGQHGVWSEKGGPYDLDARVLLAMRGPGVTPHTTTDGLVSMNVDMPATILDLAGIPDGWADGKGRRDGVSLRPLLGAGMGAGAVGRGRAPAADAADAAVDSSSSAPTLIPTPPTWRDRVLIEFVGWASQEWLAPCSWGLTPTPCAANDTTAPAGLVNSPSNVYTALRVLNATHNTLYAEFRPPLAPLLPSQTNWTEAYDLVADPWQTNNLAVKGRLPAPTLAEMQKELWGLAACVGAACP
jgi:N-acetylglucosamine-6-sulfatase